MAFGRCVECRRVRPVVDGLCADCAVVQPPIVIAVPAVEEPLAQEAPKRPRKASVPMVESRTLPGVMLEASRAVPAQARADRDRHERIKARYLEEQALERQGECFTCGREATEDIPAYCEQCFEAFVAVNEYAVFVRNTSEIGREVGQLRYKLREGLPSGYGVDNCTVCHSIHLTPYPISGPIFCSPLCAEIYQEVQGT